MANRKFTLLVVFLLALSSFTVGRVLMKEISHRQNPQKAAQEEGEFLVISIIDGNTIELETGEKVRYIGLEAPKLLKDKIECYAREALWENKRLVLNKTVSLEKDVSEMDTEGNLLRYVWLYGKMINLELVNKGYAKAYLLSPNKKYNNALEEAEKHAQENNLGLWSRCKNLPN